MSRDIRSFFSSSSKAPSAIPSSSSESELPSTSSCSASVPSPTPATGNLEEGEIGDDEEVPKKVKKRSFVSSWLHDPLFKQWLMPPSRHAPARCSACKHDFPDNANRTSLVRHSQTPLHLGNLKNIASNKILSNEKAKEDITAASKEVKLAAFIAEHDISHRVGDHFDSLVKTVFPQESRNIKLKRSKLSYVINSIGQEEADSVVLAMRNNCFSLFLDESTDSSMSQNLAIVVRIKGKDKFLCFLPVEDGTAKGLFLSISNLFDKEKIPWENIVAVSVDNCATMVGSHGGLQKYLRDKNKYVIVLGCVCHQLALCSRHACEKLPENLDTMLHDLSSYYSNSPKRTKELQNLQELMGVSRKKMKKYCQTRWLCRADVIAYVLENFDVLVRFFSNETHQRGKEIHSWLRKPATKVLLSFLNHLLSKVDAVNRLFQSSETKIHVLNKELRLLYSSVLTQIMKNSVMADNLLKINLSNPALYRPEPKLGWRADSLLREMEAEVEAMGKGRDEVERKKKEVSFVKKVCLEFLLELARQMKQRFFSGGEVVKLLSCIDPDVFKSEEGISMLMKLASTYTCIVKEAEWDQLGEEAEELQAIFSELIGGDLSIDSFWTKVGETGRFPLVSKLVSGLLSIPHSNASVERVFSLMNFAKDKRKSHLRIDRLTNRLLAKQAVISQGGCHSFIPSHGLINCIASGAARRKFYETHVPELSDDDDECDV